MSRLHSVSYLALALVIVAALTLGAAGGAVAGGLAGFTYADARAVSTGPGALARPVSWAGTVPVQPADLAVQQGTKPTEPGVVNATDAEDQLLEQLYQRINQSVVNIAVTSKVSQSSVIPNLPNIPGLPNPFGRGQGQGQGQQNFTQQAEGSGWVYDTEGDIVTNNHVVDGADRITVTFYDDRSVTAKLVGADPDSDLAVIKVDPKGLDLKPLAMGKSQDVRVGQKVVAIGNPFGLEGTMTTGIISALGRSLPAGSANGAGARYTIPDIIQTDAAINPGNSGGVLLNTAGEMIGVTSAIESPVRANSGVGFAIPSRIVGMVVPVLIQSGKVEHPWIGISGTTLNPQLNQAMNLAADQRGVLVVDVTKGGPADKASMQGSSKSVDIDGEQVKVGGDLIVGIDDQKVLKFDDLLTYLLYNAKVGQNITLKVMRDGKPQDVTISLAPRPAQSARVQTQNDNGSDQNP
jgi:serine protease Do